MRRITRLLPRHPALHQRELDRREAHGKSGILPLRQGVPLQERYNSPLIRSSATLPSCLIPCGEERFYCIDSKLRARGKKTRPRQFVRRMLLTVREECC